MVRVSMGIRGVGGKSRRWHKRLVIDGSEEVCGEVWLMLFFFFKQKTAYEILTCDWSSDVCSSDLPQGDRGNKKFMALPVSIKIGGAAATGNGQYKKPERCRNEN